MHNLFFTLLISSVSLMILVCFFYSLRKKMLLGHIVSGILLSAFCVLASYLPALFSKSQTVSAIFYSLYFAANTWLCATLCMYARVYTRQRVLPLWGKIVCGVIFGADILSQLSNPWMHHEVLFEYVSRNGVSCWMFHALPLFRLHLALCYVLLAIFFIDFTRKLIAVPRLYKKQYGIVLLVLGLCVLGNGIFLIFNDVIDLSVVLYGISGILLYYFTFAFLPQKLTNDMGHLVLDEVNAALAFFDADENCIYTNKLAERWFSLVRGETRLEDFTQLLRIDTQKQTEKQLAHLPVDGEDHSFSVSFQRFTDERQRSLGCFFQLDDVTDQLRAQQQRFFLATHDPLTGLYNSSTFYSEARDLLDHHSGIPYCIITTNIRQFKLLNDLLGRETGDEMLRTIGASLAEIYGPDIVCGRLESDKFAICAPAERHIEELLEETLGEKFDRLHTKYNLSLAVLNYYGVYLVAEPELPVAAMCDRANMALNVIKGDAGCHIAYYDTNLRNKMLWESKLIAEIPQALRSRQFVVYFQPQVDSRSGRIIGAEALVRWQHPENGLIAPGVFIPLLESMGLIYQLDQYVWEEACARLCDLRALGYTVPVSVNISPRDVYSGDIYQVITELMKKYELPVENLNLEITESALVLDMDRLLSIIRRLQSAGFRIEMDDFGSGYSSLNTLKDIPVDVLKLDMRFLEDAKDVERSATILKMIVGLSDALGIPLIAEGVEQKEQVDFLAGIGCHNLQGYYYSRPVPFEEFKAMLAQHETGPLE